MDNNTNLSEENDNEANIVLSEDKMSATITLCRKPEGDPYTVNELKVLLARNGVKYGVDENILEQIIEKELYNSPVVVAKGRMPVDGEDGYYEYNFRTQASSAPRILEDGSVDYLNMDLFESVTAGQVVAEYFPPTGGVAGFTVTGEIRLATPGKELPEIRGKGFSVSEDKKQYVSLMNGRIELLDDGKIEISNLYTITGDLDVSVGNVRFDGDVYVMGRMRSGLSIIANGNVVIDGHVGNVTIRSGGDVILKNGMQCSNAGYIECNGNVSGRFFEAVKIKAKGDVNANYFFNCDIESGGKITVSGNKGVIIGGRSRALLGIQAHGLGNIAEIPTYISVGITDDIREQYDFLAEKIKKVNAEIDVFQKNVQMFKVAIEKGLKKEPKDKLLFEKIQQALQLKEQEKAQYITEQNNLNEIMNNVGKSEIKVDSKACRGVHITMDSVHYSIPDTLTHVTFKREAGEIVVK